MEGSTSQSGRRICQRVKVGLLDLRAEATAVTEAEIVGDDDEEVKGGWGAFLDGTFVRYYQIEAAALGPVLAM